MNNLIKKTLMTEFIKQNSSIRITTGLKFDFLKHIL